MLKTKLLLPSTLLLSAASFACGSVYIGASTGYMIDAEEAFIAAKVGYQFKSESKISYQVEVELGYTEDSEMGIDIEIIPILANFKVAYAMSSKVDLYGGLGLGTSNVDASGFGVSMSDNVFTYQFLAGVEFNLTEKVALNLGYRYIRLNDVFDVVDVNDDLVEVGITVRF